MEESRELNAVIDVIMLAGTILLKSGSEIHRVEDTMIRIAHSQGIVDCNVLAMPAAIFFSIENTNISRMKRVTSSSYNIEKVCDVNQISRQLVGGRIDLETAFKQFNRAFYSNILSEKDRKLLLILQAPNEQKRDKQVENTPI